MICRKRFLNPFESLRDSLKFGPKIEARYSYLKKRVYVIFEHNVIIFSRFVLNLLVVAEALIVLICSYFGPKVEADCSYTIVLI